VAQLFWHMPRGTEDNHENTSHSGWSIDRVWNRTHHEHKSPKHYHLSHFARFSTVLVGLLSQHYASSRLDWSKYFSFFAIAAKNKQIFIYYLKL
jgi:hypothetical protein